MTIRKNLANIITCSRIAFALGMLLTVPFSFAFWLCYLGGGLSDILDGFAARKLNQESVSGAKLDSIADLIFTAALFLFVVCNIQFPAWVWFAAALIAGIRFLSYGIGQYKFHTFSSLHTYGNKATGILLFAFPLLCYFSGITISGILVCSVAFLSALEELCIILNSRELNRDCRSIISRKKP